MGAPTKPTASAVPVTNPTRESAVEGGERGGEGGGREDGVCNSCADKLEKSNSETMSCLCKATTEWGSTQGEVGGIVYVHTDPYRLSN